MPLACRLLGVTEQDQRLLGQVQIAGVDQHLARRREPLRAALALDAPQACLQRRRSRGPDQPVPGVEHRQQPAQPSRPTLGRVGSVLRRPERVVGDEQLAPAAVERAARPGRDRCTRAPPSRRSAAPARSSARSRSCPSPGARSAPRSRARRAPPAPGRYARVGQNTRASSCAPSTSSEDRPRTSESISAPRSRNPSTDGIANRSPASRSSASDISPARVRPRAGPASPRARAGPRANRRRRGS